MPSAVYIRTCAKHTTLYTGVTADLTRRDAQHRTGKGGKFSSKYKTTKLVWYRHFESIIDAIDEEKRIKSGSRSKKIALIESINPGWDDLSADWFR
jgi:putative endonuclease